LRPGTGWDLFLNAGITAKAAKHPKKVFIKPNHEPLEKGKTYCCGEFSLIHDPSGLFTRLELLNRVRKQVVCNIEQGWT
jgi:hypothetical protein